MITVQQLNKTYRIAKRNAGMKEAVSSLFHKEYTEIAALKDVSFDIQKGEIVAYIGPNGAGKSSTIKIMSGILTPDSGTCVVNGYVPWQQRKEYVRHIGVVFGQRSQLWWDVPVIDSLELIRDIYQVEGHRYRCNLEELTVLLDLEELLKTPARQLSLGQRMRCEIAASLLHDPQVLFLDEPTIGLDAISKHAVQDFIRKLNQEKQTTVILTTHDMQDVEALSERILLIGKGEILLDGSLGELKKRYGTMKTIQVEYSGGALSSKAGMALSRQEANSCTILVNTEILSISEAIAHISQHLEVSDLSIASASAEEMVMSLYQEFQL